ncbi:hypothetical protein IFM89_015010, partial [Coptis chinensis]
MIVEVCYINCNGILLTHLHACRMGQNFSRQVNKVFQILILGASIEILQGLSHILFLHTYIYVCEEMESSYSAKLQQSKNSLSCIKSFCRKLRK